jgi:hypothetical protein
MCGLCLVHVPLIWPFFLLKKPEANQFVLVAMAGVKEAEYTSPAAKKIDFMAGISTSKELVLECQSW